MKENLDKYEILYVLPSNRIIGAQKVAFDYIQQFIKNNYKVALVSKINYGKNNINFRNVRVFNTDYKRFSRNKGLRILEELYNIFRCLKKIRSDNIISVSPFLNRYLCLLKFFKIINCNLIIEEHSYPEDSYREEFNIFARLLYKTTEYLYNFSNKIRVLSPEAKNYFQKKILSKNKIFYMQNLLDINEIKKNSLKKIPNNITLQKPYICYIGRFEPQKNIKFLLKSYSLIASKVIHNLYIIGFGSEEKFLKNLVKYYQLTNRIKFLKSSKFNNAILRNSDFFPITSLWEGMPLTMIEAMTLKVPIISTNFKTGPKLLLGENERGYVIKSNNEELFAKSMIEIIKEKNSKKLKSKVTKAKKFIEKEIDIDRNFTKFISIFIETNR